MFCTPNTVEHEYLSDGTRRVECQSGFGVQDEQRGYTASVSPRRPPINLTVLDGGVYCGQLTRYIWQNSGAERK